MPRASTRLGDDFAGGGRLAGEPVGFSPRSDQVAPGAGNDRHRRRFRMPIPRLVGVHGRPRTSTPSAPSSAPWRYSVGTGGSATRGGFGLGSRVGEIRVERARYGAMTLAMLSAETYRRSSGDRRGGRIPATSPPRATPRSRAPAARLRKPDLLDEPDVERPLELG